MNKIKCVRCGTENEEEFKFCKYCGTVLPKVEEKFSVNTPINEFGGNNPIEDDFDGVPESELSAYFGKRSDSIMPKMYAMKLNGKKTSWCTPVFLLGLFFGFFGMAFWFFYRKMKKLGTISLLLGVCFYLGDAIVNFNSMVRFFSEYINLLGAYSVSGMNPSMAYTLIEGFENAALTLSTNTVSIISDLNGFLGHLVCPILMGIYSMNFYKMDAVTKIKEFKATAPCDNYYMMRISLLGGTSGGLVVIPVAVMIVIQIAASVATIVAALGV